MGNVGSNPRSHGGIPLHADLALDIVRLEADRLRRPHARQDRDVVQLVDTIAGGTGADRYVFLAASGNDQIAGFNAGEGDRLDLSGQTFTLSTAADGAALITLSGGGTIMLTGIAPASFSPGFVV